MQSDVRSTILGDARTLPRQGRRQHWCEERAFNHQRGSGDFCAGPIAFEATAPWAQQQAGLQCDRESHASKRSAERLGTHQIAG
ncbi:MAG TPA: hypothetical protein DDX19_04615 [Rhodopirellula baltica]|nr:hypothetical protein [Rhodopirellula baltica]